MNLLRSIRDAYRRCLQRLLRPNPVWKESELFSPDGLVFRVRTAQGHETQVRGNDDVWRPVSAVKWSRHPRWEEYHKDQFARAKPWMPNVMMSGPEDGANSSSGSRENRSS